MKKFNKFNKRPQYERKEKENQITLEQLKNMNMIELTQFIEEQASLVISNPEMNIAHLDLLVKLLEHSNIIVVQMTILSLTEVFVDIAPLYKIDKNAHEQKLNQMIKKEEQQMVNFELRLLKNYELFTQSLFAFIRAFDNKKEKTQNETNLCYTALRSICQLLFKLHHFNRTRLLIQHATFALLNPSEIVQNEAKQALIQILSQKQHSLHELKMHILMFLTKLLQTKPENQLPNDFMEIVNSTKFDTKFLSKEIEKEEMEKKRNFKRKKRDFFKQKDKTKQQQVQEMKKLLKEVKKEKEEADPDMDKKILAKNNGEILSKLFYIYFKILKQEKVSKYYALTMDGILLYVHLINVELIGSLMDNLIKSCKHLRSQKKQNLMRQRLQTIYTLQEIMNGPGQAFEMDDKETVCCLYQCIIDLIKNKQKDFEDQWLLLLIMQASFLERRQFSQEVVGSFIKQLVNLGIGSHQKFQYCLLYFVKQLLMKYTKTQKMLEEDNEGYGLLNHYNANAEDPIASNSINSSIYQEVKQLQQEVDI